MFENIVPNTEKQIRDSVVESDLTTKIGSVKLLYQQIEEHKKAIQNRSGIISEANDLKNESDLAIIKDLEKQIQELQN
jgi:hypothetical protein